jgi:hypothetical protein
MTIICGRETWSLTLREEHRLRVFENRVLRRIFEPKINAVTEGRGKLHNKEPCDLYSLPSITRTIKFRIGWACSMVSGDFMQKFTFLFLRSQY